MPNIASEALGFTSPWSYATMTHYQVTNNVALALSNYPVRVQLPTNYVGQGLTVTDTSYNLLDFCYETSTGECTTDPTQCAGYIWVKIPSLPSSGTFDFYVILGGNSATTGDNVFWWYDDFNSYTSVTDMTVKWYVSSSNIQINGDGTISIVNATGGEVIMVSKQSFSYQTGGVGYAVEWRELYVSEVANSGWDTFFQTTDPSTLPGQRDTDTNMILAAPFAKLATGGMVSKIWVQTNGTWSTLASGTVGDTTTWHIFRTHVDSKFNIALIQDPFSSSPTTLVTGQNTNFTSMTGYLIWREGDHTLDWVRLRPVADTEPTVTLVGTQEGKKPIWLY